MWVDLLSCVVGTDVGSTISGSLGDIATGACTMGS